MTNKTVIEIAQYAAPYKGNFIASLESLEEVLHEKGANRMVYIFPGECRKTKWIKSFIEDHVVYFVASPGKSWEIRRNEAVTDALRKIFREERPDIIHCHFDGYNIPSVKANVTKARIIWHMHNERSLVDNNIKRLYQKIMFFKEYALVADKRICAVTTSPATEEFLREYGFRGRVKYIPNGIKTERIEFQYHKPENIIRFLNFGGRFSPKGLDILLQATRKLIHMDVSDQFVLYITKGQDTVSTANHMFGGGYPSSDTINRTDRRCKPVVCAS